MQSFQNAKSSFSNIIKTLSPDLLIYDSFQLWAAALSALNNIPSVHLATSGAATMSFFYNQHISGSHSDIASFPFPEIFQWEYGRQKFQALVDSDKGVAEDFAFRSFEQSSDIVFDQKLQGNIMIICLSCMGEIWLL
ncbi:hypothetical protein ACH5RR_031101 [Cinchona calisaya]|uniref:Uncharacterized protein n=1 Tax=Cinchona calisaya TaxID=153742 RepID=A0ABD2YI87_9GENT